MLSRIFQYPRLGINEQEIKTPAGAGSKPAGAGWGPGRNARTLQRRFEHVKLFVDVRRDRYDLAVKREVKAGGSAVAGREIDHSDADPLSKGEGGAGVGIGDGLLADDH